VEFRPDLFFLTPSIKGRISLLKEPLPSHRRRWTSPYFSPVKESSTSLICERKSVHSEIFFPLNVTLPPRGAFPTPLPFRWTATGEGPTRGFFPRCSPPPSSWHALVNESQEFDGGGFPIGAKQELPFVARAEGVHSFLMQIRPTCRPFGGVQEWSCSGRRNVALPAATGPATRKRVFEGARATEMGILQPVNLPPSIPPSQPTEKSFGQRKYP